MGATEKLSRADALTAVRGVGDDGDAEAQRHQRPEPPSQSDVRARGVWTQSSAPLAVPAGGGTPTPAGTA